MSDLLDLSLDQVTAQLETLSPEDLAELAKEYAKQRPVWMPNSGPQMEAYFSKADVLLYGGQAAGGKALDLDTPIPTPFGWTTMAELKPGDAVFDENGGVCHVTVCSPVMIGRPCYRVTFSDGAEIIADADHRWVTLTQLERDSGFAKTEEWRARRRAARPSRAKENSKSPWLKEVTTRLNKERKYTYLPPPAGSVRTTTEIAETLSVSGRRGGINHSVAVAGALDLPVADLPIDPYLFGAWLGDGSSYKAEFTIAEQEMRDLVEAACALHGWTASSRAGLAVGVGGGMLVALRGTGALANKHIPISYLRGSKEQRIALLQGLMDTDGYADPRGGCEFTTIREELAQNVKELLLSLGCKASIMVGNATLRGRVISLKYRIKFFANFPAFRLQRKLDRQKMESLRPTTLRRYITSVEKTESVPVKCIAVDSDSRLYLCGKEMIPTHNTDLGLGLAFTQHQRSLILRRQYTDLSGIIDRAIEIHGSRDGFSGAIPPRLRTADGRLIQFGAHKDLGDEKQWMGIAFDYKYFDEAVFHLEEQVKLHLGWIRTAVAGQRTRTIFGTNPPTDASGDWIIGMFRPWLDITHSNPAKPGELRWYITTPEGEDVEVEDATPREFTVKGKKVVYQPKSRTFIPSALSDNPFLINTGYQATLDALPEPLRSAVRDGNFMATRMDAAYQVIPSSWVTEAQARWKPDGGRSVAMTAMAYDPAGGGRDTAELICRHGSWFAQPITTKGAEVTDGSLTVALLFQHRRNGAVIIIDVGGGYAGQTALRLKDNETPFTPFDGNGSGVGRDKSGRLKFTNARSMAWWGFREALDPDQPGGSVIALPPNPALVADLTAPVYEVNKGGITIESKESIRKRLGRSPGKGDVVVMAYTEGEALARRISNGGGSGQSLPTQAKSTRKGPLQRRRG